mmetsp:Transcript_58433/g.189233  ORF Transcript_58433/g.189233 Transcript_58433/m.189233 type:complete len:94 (+) Transcript_58433:3-284(+)
MGSSATGQSPEAVRRQMNRQEDAAEEEHCVPPGTVDACEEVRLSTTPEHHRSLSRRRGGSLPLAAKRAVLRVRAEQWLSVWPGSVSCRHTFSR